VSNCLSVYAGGMQGSDCGSSVVVHQLKSSDGGILDPDDRLCDVVDDREQVPPHTHARSIDVKKFFYVFLFWSRFYVFNVFLFSKRWQSSERQAD